jgi:hypothetical protein
MTTKIPDPETLTPQQREQWQEKIMREYLERKGIK